MGLDMYLHAKKYVEKVNWQALQDNDELSYDSPEAVFPKWNEIVEVADMKDVATDIYGVDVEVTCAYWCKSNQIHKWFVDNVQDGNDNCGEYYVSLDDIEKLVLACDTAWVNKDTSILPPESGFFFGSTDTDEWYWEQIRTTSKRLREILEDPTLQDASLFYQSSW